MSVFKFLYTISASLMIAMSPSLLRRLRARLSGVPNKTEVPIPVPTAAELAEEGEVLRKAIEEAVTTALHNSDFTKAVAVTLALQIQPLIKTALHPFAIEPMFLAVNQELSKQLEANNAQNAAKLSDLLKLIDANNIHTLSKISTLGEAVAQISTSLAELQNTLKGTQDQVTALDSTALSLQTATLDTIATSLQKLQEQGPVSFESTIYSHTGTLDTITSELHSIKEQIASPDTSLLSSHTTKLDTIASELVAIRDNADVAAVLKSVISELTYIKADIAEGNAFAKSDYSELNKKTDTVLSTIGRQIAKLFETARENSQEILSTVKTSTESQTAQATELAGIKTAIETQSQALSDIQSADVSAELFTCIEAANESHAANATSLAEIKVKQSATTDTITEFKATLNSIISTLDIQMGTLGEIKTSSSHNNEIVALGISANTIITTLDSQTTTLGEIKAASADISEIVAIGKSVKTIATKLDSYGTALGEIKAASTGTEILAAIAAQGTALTELKEASSSNDVLASIETVKTHITESNGAIVDKVESIKTLVDAAGASSDKRNGASTADILQEMKAVKSAIGENVAVIGVLPEESKEDIQAVTALDKENAAGPTKEFEVLAELKDVKILHEGENEPDSTAQKVGDDDNGVEIQDKAVETGITTKTESNGVMIETKEVDSVA